MGGTQVDSDRPDSAVPFDAALRVEVSASVDSSAIGMEHTVEFCSHEEANPARTLVEHPCGQAFAILTAGARTAVIFGTERRINESDTPSVVTHAWVRLLPSPHAAAPAALPITWLGEQAASQTADLIALATQYLAGSAPAFDGGLQVAGDADYGPLGADGNRIEGSDFNDYLGIPWTYSDGVIDQPEVAQLRSLDCSGFMRMIWGYRSGFPLARAEAAAAGILARRAVQMETGPTGVWVIANTGAQPDSRASLQPGDLLFFDASVDDGPAVDHVGMFLGRDEAGHERFVSSRKGANGPTMGDVRGASILDGKGLYAVTFRSARRL